MWRPYIPAWSISSCMFNCNQNLVSLLYICYVLPYDKRSLWIRERHFCVGVRYLLVFGKSLISSKTHVDLDRSSQHKKNETVGIVRYAGRSRELLYRYHYWLMYEDTMFGKCEISSHITIPENKEKQLCSIKKNNCTIKPCVAIFFLHYWLIVVYSKPTKYYNNIYELY